MRVIVEGAARILERGTAAKLSTNRIARAAGVSVGTLYQYFADKQSVIAQLSRDSRDERVRSIRAALVDTQDFPCEQALAQLVRAGLELELTRPTLAEALDRHEVELSLDGSAIERELERLLVTFLARYFHGHADALAVTANEMRLTAQVIAEAAAKRGPVEREATVHKITQTLLALLDASLQRRAG